ncbi:MAG: hypothetical protein BRC29_04375 [Nanohaloarchaea archaeon SW_7_43_1]|nr:MAG: hypothetical protein BRC29_04375 [Nanohaloarchaea archaeon SW_7_43_1]
MANEILSEIEQMESKEFGNFSRYLQEVSSSFIGVDRESSRTASKNVKELSEAGGDAFALGKLCAILTESDDPEEYCEKIRDYREETTYQNEVDGTINEIFSGFFDEKEDYL